MRFQLENKLNTIVSETSVFTENKVQNLMFYPELMKLLAKKLQ